MTLQSVIQLMLSVSVPHHRWDDSLPWLRSRWNTVTSSSRRL